MEGLEPLKGLTLDSVMESEIELQKILSQLL